MLDDIDSVLVIIVAFSTFYALSAIIAQILFLVFGAFYVLKIELFCPLYLS